MVHSHRLIDLLAPKEKELQSIKKYLENLIFKNACLIHKSQRVNFSCFKTDPHPLDSNCFQNGHDLKCQSLIFQVIQ